MGHPGTRAPGAGPDDEFPFIRELGGGRCSGGEDEVALGGVAAQDSGAD